MSEVAAVPELSTWAMLILTRDRLLAVFLFTIAELQPENAKGPCELLALAQALNPALIALLRGDQSMRPIGVAAATCRLAGSERLSACRRTTPCQVSTTASELRGWFA
jgi:hypothetical protein